MDIQGMLVDLEGTLIHNGKALPGAPRFLAEVQKQGVPIRVITNSVGRSAGDMASALQLEGMNVPVAHIITPLKVLDRFLESCHTDSYIFIGPDYIRERLTIQPKQSHETPPDYVVLCDFERISFGYEKLNDIFQLLLRGSKLLTLSSSPYYLSNESPKLDTGAFARLFESASGQTAIALGKPSLLIYETAMSDLTIPMDRVMAVGDDVQTDVIGAKTAGLKAALVRTGKYQNGDEHVYTPDAVVDTLTDLLFLL